MEDFRNLKNFLNSNDLSTSIALEKKMEEFHFETLKLNYKLTEDLFLSELGEETRERLLEDIEEVKKDCKEFLHTENFEKIFEILKPINRCSSDDNIIYSKNLGISIFLLLIY